MYIINNYFVFTGDNLHPKYASLFQIFERDELADIMLDTIVFYVKGRIEGVPLYGISGELGSVLNLKYIAKHRVRSGMLDKVPLTSCCILTDLQPCDLHFSVNSLVNLTGHF